MVDLIDAFLALAILLTKTTLTRMALMRKIVTTNEALNG